jgi:2-polyprenyl-6-methoxyphenol hydroxylase-like FAD-dependent oxidoreductase
MGSADPVVVVGGSIGGLATALALGRAGEQVLVLERDDIHLADDAEQAFAVDRAGAPQAHQTHGFLARLVVTLRERFPDVLEQIIASGARVISMTSELEGVEEGDDDLAVLIVRRTTFEWALRKAVLGEPNTEVRGGVGVRGLRADTSGDGPPRVTGVVLEDGSELTAKAVVVASGRRGLVEPWLAPFGVAVPEELHETGHVYLTRWYRFHGEVDLAKHTRLGGDLGWLKFLAIPGDGDTLSATLAVRTKDSDVRALLADAKRFDTALRMLPGPAALLEETRAEAITDVLPMAGLINRLRRFVDSDGRPSVLGFHAVGDAHTCTNPLYGRGCSLAIVQATLLADAFVAHPDDATARSRDYEAASGREVEPWYRSAVMLDSFRPPEEGGAGVPPDDPIARVMATGQKDPVVSRAIARVFNLLAQPEQVFTQPELLARVAEILAAPPEPIPVEGPTRREMLAAVA